ncbi:hypothetical protein GRI38_06540 [Altererythrobacter aurantiacus]|uniref:Uncharacterized protein n=1 Tax=Parapontixanthobacter aurantiacus TaxID=1463599 RepID=A0A844ZFC4_9SPHN|nr:hypothetical protein [Parapontixanthobacter aurantiacus]MXO85687.1 hypothetical protein [Parapontixanthobacter aurantiacus]
MPERQSRHPDNDLIDEMKEQPTPSQQGSSGGEVNRRVGKRAELNRATDPDNREPVVGSDNPQEDAQKGPKSRAAIQEKRENN